MSRSMLRLLALLSLLSACAATIFRVPATAATTEDAPVAIGGAAVSDADDAGAEVSVTVAAAHGAAASRLIVSAALSRQ